MLDGSIRKIFWVNENMANDLVTQNETRALARVFHTVDSLYRSIERDRYGNHVLPSLPSAEVRQSLIDRKGEVDFKLWPITRFEDDLETVKTAMAAFLGAYLNIRVQNQEGVVALYVAHL